MSKTIKVYCSVLHLKSCNNKVKLKSELVHTVNFWVGDVPPGAPLCMEVKTVTSWLGSVCHLHIGKLFFPTYKQRKTKKWTSLFRTCHCRFSECVHRGTWELSLCPLTFHCRVTVMWRLQTGFLRRSMVPAMESPENTLTGLSSIKRVCFQWVGLMWNSKFGAIVWTLTFKYNFNLFVVLRIRPGVQLYCCASGL